MEKQEKTSDFRFLILGAGRIVTEYYLPALRLLRSLDKAFFIDPSAGALKNLLAIFPQAKYQQIGFEEYLRNSDKSLFDAAVIALPNHLHAQAAELAMSCGWHVLCEKPLAMNTQDCLRLDKLSKENGRVLTVGMVRRLLPCVLALRRAADEGLIGSLKEIDVAWGEPYIWGSETGEFFQPENGGILSDLGVHFLDLAQELTGPLKPVDYKDDWCGGVEANAEFKAISKEGIKVSLSLSRTHKLRNTIILKGQTGELVLEKDVFDSCKLFSYENKALFSRLYPLEPFRQKGWNSDLVSCFAEQFLYFRDAVNGEKNSMATANQAAGVMALVEWAYNRRKEGILSLKSPISSESKRPFLSSVAPVVVTGGTGFIGGQLVSRLSELGFTDIQVPVRNYMTCSGVARFPVKLPKINLLDYNQVKDVIRGARYVFHLAYGKTDYDAARVTIQGTSNVVNAAIECKAECVVVLSTMFVFGSPKTDRLIDESWPYRPIAGEYAKTKAVMERWCLKRALKSLPTRIVVLNPSCVYGPSGSTYTQLPLQMADKGLFCWVNKGIGTANYTFIDNLIDAIMLAADCKEASGQRIIINDGFCSWRDFLLPILGEKGDKLPSFTKKELQEKTATLKDIFYHFADDMEFIYLVNRIPLLKSLKRLLFGFNPKLYEYALQVQEHKACNLDRFDCRQMPPAWLADIFGVNEAKFSSEKARKLLNWQPLVSLEEGQNRSIQWLKSIGLL